MTGEPFYDAAIVGFGPTGATLANLLARGGLDIAVVDAAREIYDKPRAITLDHEVMRIFQACGCAHAIAPLTAPHPGTRYLGVDGRVIKKFDPLPPPHPLGWPPTVTFVQPELEALLRAGVADARNVDILLGEPVVAFAQDGEGVTLTLRERPSLRARYLLACDGANSFVRRELNVPLEDLVRRVVVGGRRPAHRGSRAAEKMHPVLLAVAPGHFRPRSRQSAPMGDQDAARRNAGGIRTG